VKRKILRLTILLLTLFTGWFLGYLKLPFAENIGSFWMGFISCLGIIMLAVLVRLGREKGLSITEIFLRKQSVSNQSINIARVNSWRWIGILFVVIAAGAFGLVIQQQLASFRAETEEQNRKLQDVLEIAESVRRGNQAYFTSNLLNKIDDEVKTNPLSKLSDNTISRITALSLSFKPYRIFQGDSLSTKELSPERGQLLNALLRMGIDSTSFARIKSTTSFAKADLHGADLEGMNLSGVDLREANLQDAVLNGANLSGADLRGSNLHRAHINHANLSAAQMRNVYMGWAECNETNLKNVNLNGANLENAQFRKADLSDALIQWTFMNNTLFVDANFSGTDLVRSEMNRSNLTNANLVNTNFYRVVINEAILSGASLAHAEVQNIWFEDLAKYNVAGAEHISKNYVVVQDTSGEHALPVFYLELVE